MNRWRFAWAWLIGCALTLPLAAQWVPATSGWQPAGVVSGGGGVTASTCTVAGQIPYTNAANDLACVAGFRYNAATNVLTVGNVEGLPGAVSLNITAATPQQGASALPGQDLFLNAGQAVDGTTPGDAVGGRIALQAGDGVGASAGGSVTINGGDASGTGPGGDVTIVPGAGVGGDGVIILAGAVTASTLKLTRLESVETGASTSALQLDLRPVGAANNTGFFFDGAYGLTVKSYGSLVSAYNGAVLQHRSDGVLCFTAATTPLAACDTGISRGGAAGVTAFGNGSAGDYSGTLKAATVMTGPGVAVKAGGTVKAAAPGATTTGTTEEVLATVSLPAGFMSTNGDSLAIQFFAHGATNANNKQLRVRIGGLAGTLLFDSGAIALNNYDLFTLPAQRLVRQTSTTATFQGFAYYNTAQAASVTFASNPSVTWANALDLVITGETPSASGDLTLLNYSVTYNPAN